MSDARQAEKDAKRLDHLMVYTTFHIGLYGAILGATISHLKPSLYTPYSVGIPLLFGGVFMVIAGAAGGAIAGTIPGCGGYEEFTSLKFRPRLLRWLPGNGWDYYTWSFIEHASFWLGLAGLLTALIVTANLPPQ